MDWIFPAFLFASIVHMLEEYILPGGFTEVMRRSNPRLAPHIGTPMVVVINGLQLLLCMVAIWAGSELLPFSLSVASLLFINGWVHVLASIWLKRYVPGAISGSLLYIPLSISAYTFFLGSGQLTQSGGLLSVVLGVLYQSIPIAYPTLTGALKRA